VNMSGEPDSATDCSALFLDINHTMWL
jgi:hypothetical protein